MVTTSIISLLWIATAISSTSALPSRTHCRCTIIDSSSPSGLISQNPEILSPSTSRTPSIQQLHSPSQADICHALGPELENFRYTNPKAYSDFLAHSSSTEVWVDPTAASPTQELTPLTTTVLLQLGSRKGGLTGLGVEVPSGAARRPEQRIRCTTEEVQDFKAYQDSVFTLLALQIIVAFAVLACVVETVMLIVRWLCNAPSTDGNGDFDDFFENAPAPSGRPALRLSGAERRLRAFPSSESISSPGADKKSRFYRSQSWSPSSTYSEKKVFEAWVDEDDEMNRPVM